MSDETKPAEKLDTPRKCLDWAKKKFKWSEDAARNELGLPAKGKFRPKATPGGPFVSCGDPKLDALLKLTVVFSEPPSEGPAEPELELAAAGERWWQWRERIRADRSDAKPRMQPYFLEGLPDRGGMFFVHCSRKEPDKIIYTPDNAFGRADRRVMTTVGRFLTKHYSSHYGAAQIKRLAEEHNATYANPTVYFAFGATDIVDGYEKGPTSCMVGKNFKLIENPVAVYDGPDTLLAVIKRGDKISARCLIDVRPSPMTFTRIYGDDSMMRSRLMTMGFVEKMGIAKARLRKIIEPKYNRPLCPYVDGHSTVAIDGEFMVLDGGTLRCGNQHGMAGASELREIPAEDHAFTCGHCHTVRNEGSNQQVDHAGTALCATCLEEHYVYAVRDRLGMRRYLRRTDCIWVEDTESWYWNTEQIRDLHHLAMSVFHGEWVHTAGRKFNPEYEGWFRPDEPEYPKDASEPKKAKKTKETV